MHYRRVKTDPVYKAAFEEAWQIGVGAVEDAAVENAVIGYEEPVIFKGQLQYTALRSPDGKVVRGNDGEPTFIPLTVFRPNPTLHMFVMRGMKPEKYRERYQVEHTGLIGIEERLNAGRKRVAKRKHDGKPGSNT